MRSTANVLTLCGIPALFMALPALQAQESEKPRALRTAIRKIAVDGLDKSSWRVHDEQKACALTKRVLGLPERSRLPIGADVVTFDKINIPFLHDQIINRPVWRVTVRDFVFELESSPAGLKDMYIRILDTFVDPRTGQVLRVRTRLPEGFPTELREPSAEFATWQLFGGTKETYHGFPTDLPGMSFVDAVDAVQRGGWNPLASDQVTGEWVMWSTYDKKPRPVWVITLQGMPPFEASYPGVPVDARNHLRIIVDPVSKSWIEAGTSPQPE